MLKTMICVIALALSITVLSASAETRFSLSDYQDLKSSNIGTAKLILRAMREAVYYAQESNGDTVICASPPLIAGDELVKMIDREIAHPTNPDGRAYEAGIPAAFVFVHALKNQGVCR